MRDISILVKPASGLCNMHCDYCFYCDEAQKRQQASYGMMSVETLRNVIKRTLMRTEDVYNLAFQGGEPTLCGISFFEQVVDFVHRYNRNHAHINLALQTNGYALDENWCRFFAENHFLIGMSVDGTPEIHERYRHAKDGGRSYEHCLKAAGLMDAFHVDYNILTVVHRMTAGHIREIYQSYREHGWHYQQYIACLEPLGETRGDREYALKPETYGRFLTTLFAMWYEDFLAGQEPYIRQFDNYISILLGQEPESCEQRGTCGLQYVVEADGSVYPCDFYVLDRYRLGNFNENLLPEIDVKRSKIGFCYRSEKLPDRCRQCRWLTVCRGGCYRQRMSGCQGEANLNYFCEAYQMFFETCWERLNRAAEITRERMERAD
jgi:uncharacterized protein